MVAINPPDARAWSRRQAMFRTVLIFSLVGIVLVVLGAMPPTGLRVVIWRAVASFVAFALVDVGLYPGRLRAGQRATHPTPAVQIVLAASPSAGSGILHAAAAHLHTTYPGRSLELVARDTTVADLYAARWGLTAVTPGKGRLTGLIP